MLKEIVEIICEFVEIDASDVTARSSLRTDLGASSFDLMNVAMEIEERFHIRVPDEKLPLIKTVGDIAALLA